MIEAIQNGDLETVAALLAADPSAARAATEGGTSALLLSVYYNKPNITALLLPHIDQLTIFEAAAIGSVEALDHLLDAQPDLVNAFAPDGFTPLGLAAFFGHTQAAARLIARGANVNLASRNANRVIPLHSAVAGGHLEIVRLLLDQGADVNAQQENGFTPLHGAAENGSTAMIDLLLSHGADRHTRSDAGKSARDYAHDGGHQAAAERLEA